jgi:hypothetical protein
MAEGRAKTHKATPKPRIRPADLKAEGRNPKPEGRPKLESRESLDPMGG